MKTNILIIGGGLSGLALALRLEQKGVDYQLIEARQRLGGRIHSYISVHDSQSANFDLGPSWFWPGQPRIISLINELGLSAFEQYSTGELMYEDQYGTVQKGIGHSSMQGSYRIIGGITKIIEAIKKKIPQERYLINTTAEIIKKDDQFIHTTVQTLNNTKEVIQSNKVVLALPPRIASKLTYSPALSPTVLSAMNKIPTWMAGHAKAVVIYKNSFWRGNGLSGDAMSRTGPLVEIHDASPHNHGPYALFGFIGVHVQQRKNIEKQLKIAIIEQLIRLFGEQAKTPIDIIIQDWAYEKNTATNLDHVPMNYHPNYGLPEDLKHLWNDDLILSSTESAPEFGGYIEGALEAAYITENKLN